VTPPAVTPQHANTHQSQNRDAGYFLFFRAAAERGFAAVLLLGFASGAGAGAGAGGASPISPLAGQILKAGHFLQPTARAIGQRVMVEFLLMETGGGEYARCPPRKVVCFA